MALEKAFCGNENTGSAKGTTCDEHGHYISKHVYAGLWTPCPVCAKAEIAKHDAAEIAKDAAASRARAQKALGSSGIPPRLMERGFSDFVPVDANRAKVLSVAQAYADDFQNVVRVGRNLLMLGNPGTGKGHLAVAIGKVWLERGKTVAFVTAQNMFARVKGAWSRNSDESEMDVYRIYGGADLLIIDDVGVQFNSVTEQNILFCVIDARYNKRLPTIITSNLPSDRLSSVMGERVVDRLREDDPVVILFGFESYRKRASPGFGSDSEAAPAPAQHTCG